MEKGQIIKWVAIAGGAYAVYWYITSYGPHGKVSDTGGPSYWDTWFGGASAAPVNTLPGGVQNPAQVPAGYLPAPATTPPTTVFQPDPTRRPAPATGTGTTPIQAVQPSVKDAVMAAAMAEIGSRCDGNASNCLNADQWSYYYAQATGIPQTADLFTPNNRGELISIDTYFQRRVAAGLSGLGDIVPVATVPSVPSMSFGTNTSGYGRPSKPGRWSGGGYVQ